jgi:hypothetical protein
MDSIENENSNSLDDRFWPKVAARLDWTRLSGIGPKRPVTIGMKKAHWKETAELIGIVAIVASLIFVGFQLKQDRDVAFAESAQSLESSAADLNALLAEHAAVWVKARNEEKLSEAELEVMKRLVDALHRRARYSAQQRRTLGMPGIAALRDLAILLYESPGARRIWEEHTENEAMYFDHLNPDDDFRRRYRNEILAELNKLDELGTNDRYTK